MKHYIDPQSEEIYAYEDSAENFIQEGLIPISDNDLVALRVKQAIEQAPSRLRNEAKSALVKSDTTILRCVESGKAVPADWNTYRKALRAILNETDLVSTVLPVRPDYPVEN